MEQDSKPTVAEAVDAAQAIENSWGQCGCMRSFFIYVGFIIALLVPWILIVVLPCLIGIGIYQYWCCKAKKIILNTFARNRNWFLEPEEVLRHVEGHERRKRFYADPRLISIEAIIGRVKNRDFDSRPAPPTGEVPRKSPASGNSSFGGDTKEKMVDWAGTPTRHTRESLSALVAERDRRIQEAMQHAEEEKRRGEVARQRAEEEKRRGEEARQRAEEKKRRAEETKRRAEEIQRRLEEPRFRLFLDETWTDLMSVKEVGSSRLLMGEDGLEIKPAAMEQDADAVIGE